jgi:hypothetical protein
MPAYERQRLLATGAWRDFHENKTARLPYVDPSTEYARALRHLQAPASERTRRDARRAVESRETRPEHSRTPLLGRKE